MYFLEEILATFVLNTIIELSYLEIYFYKMNQFFFLNIFVTNELVPDCMVHNGLCAGIPSVMLHKLLWLNEYNKKSHRYDNIFHFIFISESTKIFGCSLASHQFPEISHCQYLIHLKKWYEKANISWFVSYAWRFNISSIVSYDAKLQYMDNITILKA